ncbi:DNA repair protein RecN [Thioflexithrix psekupsensis]|uniref:DNA repair protein RecN n=1 Tax=Thioflexithrix psekupsensis TaxID=1570016 RepID=A0A251XBL3_9GAMM|nr:DNA repair protein RecN [Thioflexithrix psekupsensis]OUD16040.1 DNA repair protein RecN [Thioflexithrix psekupsensis]
MLHRLQIENIAIVERQTLHLTQGLTVITGETGAGKSILIDALSVVLGARADSGVVRQGCEQAQVSAVFRLSESMINWLRERDLTLEEAEEDDCVIRRVITAKGRSRCYLNDRPVSLQTLKELGEQLVDIHGQHAHQSLLKLDVQRDILDAMATDPNCRAQVTRMYQEWRELNQALTTLGGEARDRDARLALLRYQVQELEQFELTDTALKELSEEHKLCANSQRLLDNVQRVLSYLDAEDGTSIITTLNQANRELAEVCHFDPRLNQLKQQLDSLLIQADDLTSELRHYSHHVDLDPNRLSILEEKLSDLQDLARKHRVNMMELPDYFTRLSEQLKELEHYEQRAAELEQQQQAALIRYQKAAEALRQERLNHAVPLAQQITETMSQLGMPGGQLRIEVEPLNQSIPSVSGWDRVEFLVSANPGQSPKPLHKVASGGELSRISLAIQVMTAQRSGVPTLIFDEVDVGIGGGVAEIVGKLLRQLGRQRQVLCITHLPQVACQGDSHLQVRKIMTEQQTHTCIQTLTPTQRVEEIARMLGGIDITAQTLAHAEEMLGW